MFEARKTGMIPGSLLVVGLLSAATANVSEAQTTGNLNAVIGAAAPISQSSVNDSLQPVQLSKTFSIGGASGNSALLFAVPTGKRLVIETVTVRAQLATSEVPDFAELLTNTTDPNPGVAAAAITSVYHEILVTRQGLDLNGRAVFIGTHPIRAYSEPGTFVFFQFGRSGVGSDASVSVSISGYLIDA